MAGAGRPGGQRAGPRLPDRPAGTIDRSGLEPGAERTLGLRWRFARVQYSAHNTDSFRARYWSDPWAIDGPAAEQNLSRRVRTVTAIDVEDPVQIQIESPQLWDNPWVYFVEPGTLRFKESRGADPPRVPAARRHRRARRLPRPDRVGQRGARVRPRLPGSPDRRPAAGASGLHCFYDLDRYPQIPGLGSFFQGRTWEKGGFTSHLRAIEDDRGRAMVLINWNTDMGDGMEWSNAVEYPGYAPYTADAYRMMINEIIYSLTH